MDAAESIEQVSPLQIDFTLKKGQMFTDGYGEMTADDVKFSFERYITPDADGRVSSYKEDWSALVEVQVHDTYSGSIILSKPSPSIWGVIFTGSSGAIQSRKAVAALGKEHSRKPIGSGPYMVSAYEDHRGVTLVRNPEFTAYTPDFETCNLVYIANQKTAEVALRAGEIQFTELSVDSADEMAGIDGVVVDKRPGQRFIWLGMNMQKAPLDKLAVRQAIRAAIDVEQMVLAGYQGNAQRLNAMIPPGLLGHWADAPVYQRNVDEARQLLASAGVALPLTLKLTILNEPAFQNMGLVAQALLQEVGINIEIDQREAGTFWSSGKGESGEQLELFILRFNANPDPTYNARWFLPNQIGDWNWQRWDSPEFARIQEESGRNLDRESRVKQIIELQKLMDETASMVWLTNDVFALGYQASVQPAVLPDGNNWQFNYFKAV
ncbi:MULTISPECIES: ABC transporter substrate-binding protein [Chelativorans]|uniref:ABC transporter substrate-binding protein n=1 Tax=Chelativorans TaxID=449972 RepID=UPI001407D3B3|nr:MULTISPECIES: ABC transporter substrate-binding protein [Chelativorans]